VLQSGKSPTLYRQLPVLTCHNRNESFTFAAGAFTPKLYAWVHDHKTLGKDKVLGEAEIDVRAFPRSFSYPLTLIICITFRFGAI
jgi:hypothetical protein